MARVATAAPGARTQLQLRPVELPHRTRQVPAETPRLRPGGQECGRTYSPSACLSQPPWRRKSPMGPWLQMPSPTKGWLGRSSQWAAGSWPSAGKLKTAACSEFPSSTFSTSFPWWCGPCSASGPQSPAKPGLGKWGEVSLYLSS